MTQRAHTNIYGNAHKHFMWRDNLSLFVKHCFDFILATALMLILWPVILVIAMLVKVSSPGPVFYRGKRAGRFGVPFRIFKFRTMVADAEQIGSATTALGDSRITKIGVMLRRYKLDELPQLLNILKGEMSFVGPRPQVLSYTDRYTAEEKLVLNVRPGITDFSSIEFSNLDEWVGTENPGKVYDEVVHPRSMALRMKYVRERSFWIDLKLIALTLALVLAKPFRSSPKLTT